MIGATNIKAQLTKCLAQLSRQQDIALYVSCQIGMCTYEEARCLTDRGVGVDTFKVARPPTPFCCVP